MGRFEYSAGFGANAQPITAHAGDVTIIPPFPYSLRLLSRVKKREANDPRADNRRPFIPLNLIIHSVHDGQL